jgi:hypothetical protein
MQCHSFHWHVQNTTIPCRSQDLLPFLSVIYFFLPLTILPSSHLLLGLPHSLVISKYICNTLLGTVFSSILCTCPNQCNLCNLTLSHNNVTNLIHFHFHNHFIVSQSTHTPKPNRPVDPQLANSQRLQVARNSHQKLVV